MGCPPRCCPWVMHQLSTQISSFGDELHRPLHLLPQAMQEGAGFQLLERLSQAPLYLQQRRGDREVPTEPRAQSELEDPGPHLTPRQHAGKGRALQTSILAGKDTCKDLIPADLQPEVSSPVDSPRANCVELSHPPAAFLGLPLKRDTRASPGHHLKCGTRFLPDLLPGHTWCSTVRGARVLLGVCKAEHHPESFLLPSGEDLLSLTRWSSHQLREGWRIPCVCARGATGAPALLPPHNREGLGWWPQGDLAAGISIQLRFRS